MNNGVERMTHFEFRGVLREVVYIETTKVRDGVECDVYGFVGDKTKDLGIIRIEEEKETPRQRVNLDPDFVIEFTEEGYFSGDGSFLIRRLGEEIQEMYEVNAETSRFSILVERGEEMKWRAGKGGLVAYEVCKPPYEDGRYIDLD
jgi:hypothetical protein